MRCHLTFEAGRRWTAPIQALDRRSAIARAGYEFEAVISSRATESATCEVRFADELLGRWTYAKDETPSMSWAPAAKEVSPPATELRAS